MLSKQLSVRVLFTAAAAAASSNQFGLTSQVFGAPQSTKLTAAWNGLEAKGTAGNNLPDDNADTASRELHLLQSLLRADEVRQVLAAVAECSGSFENDLDTVDEQPTFLWRVVDGGEIVEETLHAALKPLLYERLLPYVQGKYGCSSACVADVLIRRYLPDERRRLESHFDVSSFATAIVSLSDASDYEGGFYVQVVPGVPSRRFVDLESGDGVVHQFDLMHGVHVPSGSRYSLIVWFSDSSASLDKGQAPWVKRGAQRGNAEAMFILGGFHERGEFGHAVDSRLSTYWLRQAAGLGQPSAQARLGTMLSGGEIGAEEMLEIEKELCETAESGHHEPDGAGGEENAKEEEQRSRPDEVKSSSQGERLAVALQRRASAQGHPMAQFLLGRAYRRGEGVAADQEAAQVWLRLAEAQGSDEVAAAALAKDELDEMNAQESLASEWAKLSPVEQQRALDEVNEEQRANGQPLWTLDAMRRMMTGIE